MRITNLVLFIFLLAAFAIGSGLQDLDRETLDITINNVSETIGNIHLEKGNQSFSSGIITIVEKYIHFVGTAAIEVMRMGAFFGQENPDYFEPSFIIKIIKLIVILLIISLLIKPVFYLIIFLVMGFMWLFGRSKKKEKHEIPNNKIKK